MERRNRRRKKSKSYYTGIMVLLFICAIYLIIYPQYQKLEQQKEDQQETLVSNFSSFDNDENGDDTSLDENDPTAQAIAAIEEKEKAAKSEVASNTEEAESIESEEVSNAETVDSETEGNLEESTSQVYYKFRNDQKYKDHFKKHGGEMGFSTPEEYLDAANALINNPDALHKLEKEDNDHIYYLESTNEIAFVSQDGYLRTYFICSGRAYYDRQ